MRIFGRIVKECFCILGLSAEAIHGDGWCMTRFVVEHHLSNKINKVYLDRCIKVSRLISAIIAQLTPIINA